MFPPPVRQRFIGSFGMMSDDTEHTFLLAQALLTEPLDAAAFQRVLARKLRWWLAALPAGVGFATLRAILKLWLGVSPDRSGVWSAGNGPAMRSALLGVFFAHDAERRTVFVRASAQLTHRDPRAETSARAVAECASWMTQPGEEVGSLLAKLEQLDRGSEWNSCMALLGVALSSDFTVSQFAQQLGAGRGVSGYAFQSVPVAVYAALRHRTNFQDAIAAAIGCGGDTDTVATITGALVGARLGEGGIPPAWIDRLLDWPRSVQQLRLLARRLDRQRASDHPLGPLPYCWAAIPLRNLAFLVVVLLHGFRRLLPPYG
jgi:ADP-ribosylglycohydrolase